MKRFCFNAAAMALGLIGASAFAQAEPKPAAEAQPAAAAKPARAASGAVVEAVQMPAWVERDGARMPAAPGMPLKERDQLRTGAHSRLLLKTADGSLVKLGENVAL